MKKAKGWESEGHHHPFFFRQKHGRRGRIKKKKPNPAPPHTGSKKTKARPEALLEPTPLEGKKENAMKENEEEGPRGNVRGKAGGTSIHPT